VAIVAATAIVAWRYFTRQDSTPAPSASVAVAAPSAQESATPRQSSAPAVPVAACMASADPEPQPDEVLVYFPCDVNSVDYRPVIRSVSATTDPSAQLTETLGAFFAGPNPDEVALGFSPSVPFEWSDVPFTVEVARDGLAILSFDQSILRLGPPNSGAQHHSLVENLGATALQLLEVTAIELRVGGSCAAFAVWLSEVGTCTHIAESDSVVGDCPIVEPASLLSGAPLTPARSYRNLGGLVSWGTDEHTVTVYVSHRSSVGLERFAGSEGAMPISVRNRPGWAVPTGLELEPGVIRPAIAWDDGEGCVYAAYLAQGSSLSDLERSAALFSGIEPARPVAQGWWTWDAGTLNGQVVPVAPSIFIDSNGLAGRTRCHAYTASMEFMPDLLTIEPVQSSHVGCVGDGWAAEEMYLEALGLITSVRFEGDLLVLAGNGVELRFRR
jgi:heat shock protein HslJ